MKTEKNTNMELSEELTDTETKSDLKPLLVADTLCYKHYYGSLNHNYVCREARVVRVTDKMAEMDNGDKIHRLPRISERTGIIVDYPAWRGFDRDYYPIYQIGN